MRVSSRLLVVIAICGGVPPARAGVSVSSYQTVAGTNAFAPLSQSQFFQKQVLTNVSPAQADANGDWSGTNYGGSVDTWHWTGSAHASTLTTFNANALNIAGDGSFNWEISTTADFFDPGRVATLYAPGAGANLQCLFTVDAPATFALSCQLNSLSSVSLVLQAGGAWIVNQSNFGSRPMTVNASGTLLPGNYQLVSAASLAGIEFTQGQNHEIESGSFSSFSFDLQTPEPVSTGTIVIGHCCLARHGRRRRGGHKEVTWSP
jgi:hypothetical protein